MTARSAFTSAEIGADRGPIENDRLGSAIASSNTADVISAQGDNRLPIIAAEIKTAVASARGHARASTAAAIDAGSRLIEAKVLVAHGAWLPWLKEHVDISELSAQLYMRLARHRSVVEAKSATVADLNLRAASDLLASDLPTGDVLDDVEDLLADTAAAMKLIETAIADEPSEAIRVRLMMHTTESWAEISEAHRQAVKLLCRALDHATSGEDLGRTTRLAGQLAEDAVDCRLHSQRYAGILAAGHLRIDGEQS